MSVSFRFGFLGLLCYTTSITKIQVASAFHHGGTIQSLSEPEPGLVSEPEPGLVSEPEPGMLSIMSMSKTGKAVAGAVAGAFLGNRTGGIEGAIVSAVAGFGVGADSANRWERDQAMPPWERSILKQLGAVAGVLLAEQQDLGIPGMVLGGFGGYSVGSEADQRTKKAMADKWVGLLMASAAGALGREEAGLLGGIMAAVAGFNFGAEFQEDLTSYKERVITEILGALAGGLKGAQLKGSEGIALGIPAGYYIGSQSAGRFRAQGKTLHEIMSAYFAYLAVANHTDYTQEPNLYPGFREHLQIADQLLGLELGLGLGNATKDMFDKTLGHRNWGSIVCAIATAHIFNEKVRHGEQLGLDGTGAIILGAQVGYAIYLKVRETYVKDHFPALPKGMLLSPPYDGRSVRDDADGPSEVVVKRKRSTMTHHRKNGLKSRKQHP